MKTLIKMLNDIRVYNYDSNEPLISRMAQAKEYFDNKFANIHMEIDLSGVEGKIDTVNNDITAINQKIDNSTEEIKEAINNAADNSTSEIIDAIEGSKPCLCHLATKEDVCKAKCAIISKIEEDKDLIIKEIDDKFVDLNELIK